jgi:hypothetical protein
MGILRVNNTRAEMLGWAESKQVVEETTWSALESLTQASFTLKKCVVLSNLCAVDV